MNILSLLRKRFAEALEPYGAPLPELVAMVRPSADPKFGDYQANFAMALGKQLSRPPREIAQVVVRRLKWDDICLEPEVAGPGFINLRIRSDWLAAQVNRAMRDERLGVEPAEQPRSYVIDYSGPSVAKPMHVGHIRSTVIGDSLYRTLRFLGHRVVGDNHIGDWGTQFGMIMFGYKNFLNAEAYAKHPVEELGRLYRTVNRLVDYHEGRSGLEKRLKEVAEQEAVLERQAAKAASGDLKADKKAEQALRKLQAALAASQEALGELQRKLAAIEGDPALAELAKRFPDIQSRALAETARLHEGDAENLRLWREFMPPCLAAINEIYRRLHVQFDVVLGESFYHDRLAPVVDDLVKRHIAVESEGAVCVFFEGFDTPLIVRKRDGAFLYATTDLATIAYRIEQWNPDAILYVVDHRQSQHFTQLFAAARRWGCDNIEFQHISFGTVLGEDGRPYKTRSGDSVGLESLLDEAVRRAYEVVSAGDDKKPDGPELGEAERRRIAEVVGLGALKYADLSQNRTSDYVFSYDKMLLLNGNTATYMQYAYARVRSIFRRGGVNPDVLRNSAAEILLEAPAEQALALELARFSEALDATVADYRPNQLTTYLFELANRYSTFFEQCPVLRADTDRQRESRLLLCELTARTLKQGLALLGIDTVDQM